MNTPFNLDDAHRQIALDSYGILDTAPDERFDNIVELARAIFGAPVALLTLIDCDRQWFKAAAGIDIRETAREHSFCAHAITQPDAVTVVEDARLDPRFADNPLVTGGPGIRFYAGAPIVTDRGVALGTVCVVDQVSRPFSEADRAALARLAALAKALLDLHRREELLSRRNEFHALYELAPGFIATSEGPEHRITFANAAYRRLVGRDDLVGQTVAEALPEIVDQGFIALLDQVYRTGEPVIGDAAPILLRDPETGDLVQRYVTFVYQPVRNADRVIAGLFCEGYDATRQRRDADALGALQNALIHRARVNVMGMMATTLAHEINQPLSAISNFAAGILRRAEPGTPITEDQLGALHAIEDASQRAAAIIRNLREMTRHREPVRTRFGLALAIEECVRLVRATADPGIQITTAIAKGLELVADRVQIQQVMINLVRNACDAVTDAAIREVLISADSTADAVTICVSDTGPGLSADRAEAAFSWTISAKEDGMGLGLSICRAIVEAHGGKIWLHSGCSQGATLCFSVPHNACQSVLIKPGPVLPEC
jgi:signal transduction histidine kinase